MKKDFIAEIRGGELFYTNLDEYNHFITKNEGLKVKITLNTNRQRTIDQNAYYWLLCTIYAIHIIKKKEIVHAQNKILYLLPEIHPDLAIHKDELNKMKDFEILKIGRFLTSTKENTKEFATMIDKFRAESAIEGCYLPDSKDFEKISQDEIAKIYLDYRKLFSGK